MGQIDRRVVLANLLSKGFKYSDNDHRFLRFYVSGRKTSIQTKVSFGSQYKSLGDALISKMAHGLKITKNQFEDLVECRMSGDDYRDLLVDRGIIRLGG